MFTSSPEVSEDERAVPFKQLDYVWFSMLALLFFGAYLTVMLFVWLSQIAMTYESNNYVAVSNYHLAWRQLERRNQQYL